jgi:hypothetical protein
MAIVPIVALSMPFAHMNGKATVKADTSAKVSTSQTWNKLDCRMAQRDLVVKKYADMKAYIAAHPLKTRADVKAFVDFRHDLQAKYKAQLKDLKAKCKAAAASSKSSKSSQSSQNSTGSSVSSGVSASSVSTSSTSSSLSTTSSSLSSTSSVSSSSVTSNSSASSTSSAHGNSAAAHGFFSAFFGR